MAKPYVKMGEREREREMMHDARRFEMILLMLMLLIVKMISLDDGDGVRSYTHQSRRGLSIITLGIRKGERERERKDSSV